MYDILCEQREGEGAVEEGGEWEEHAVSLCSILNWNRTNHSCQEVTAWSFIYSELESPSVFTNVYHTKLREGENVGFRGHGQWL